MKNGSQEEKEFAKLRHDELNGLILDVTFKPVEEAVIYGQPRIFGSRFVEKMKRVVSALKKNLDSSHKTMQMRRRRALQQRHQSCSALHK